ncbi:Coenzyme F420 hydrogenase/dehydrogenase, beta subunit C-terminal domain [Shimia sp. SDUM112013]|uniref:Coenzyme F420 hydrogenase/dehydrogenase, beta subunit C-terminal domain n=1 Tax=Shimia sp. SDUM112013 TaxID=3136160 RepID=UPI0032EAACFB
MRSDPITSIVQKNLCTGCGGCAGQFPDFIRMVDDPENGRRPVVAQTPEGHKAAKVALEGCAGAATDWSKLALIDDIDRMWGPVLKTWEGWAQDTEIRHRGSSGGAVTGLAAYALDTGFAAGVAHIAARTEDPRLNEAVISRDHAGLLRGAGSRYAQASPLEAIPEIKSGDAPIVFIGKPCDVASLNKAMRHDAQLAANISLTIAIFCAGAPNLNATEQLLDTLEVPKTAKVTDLRYRGNGWPGLMQARFQTPDGTETDSKGIPYGEGWGRILQAHRRWRCRVCADHTGAFADISVGDPWHAPPKGNTDAGRSLIVARTARGQAFVEAAMQGRALVAIARDRDVIARAQPNLVATGGAIWGRRVAMRALGLAAPQDTGLKLLPLWMTLPAKQKMQSVLGTWKRVLRDRLWRRVRIADRVQ